MEKREDILRKCKVLLDAYHKGLLGDTTMPEDTNPGFAEEEPRLAYFTLPMALNYQRDSYRLWEAAKRTYEDKSTRPVFDVQKAASMETGTLREHLLRYRLALQPNRHIATWQTIAKTVAEKWGCLKALMAAADGDFLKLQAIIQKDHKRGFPYLSGPKIFHYWSFIIKTYGKVPLKNARYIDIAPDTHVTRCSVRLGIISEEEAKTLSKEQISERWRSLLQGTGIDPIDLHSPLWFWSRNGFSFTP